MIVLLRHCERDMNNNTFDSLLLGEGILNSETKVFRNLEHYNFDYIYSSPFIRCLQTLKPYIKYYEKQVDVDYNLCEAFENIKNKNQIYRNLTKVEQKEYNIKNCNYTCYFDVKSRVKCFLKYINKHHSNTDNVLVCTHECIIKEILKQKLGYYFGYHEMGKFYKVLPLKYAIGPVVFVVPYIYYLSQIGLFKEKTINIIKTNFEKLFLT